MSDELAARRRRNEAPMIPELADALASLSATSGRLMDELARLGTGIEALAAEYAKTDPAVAERLNDLLMGRDR